MGEGLYYYADGTILQSHWEYDEPQGEGRILGNNSGAKILDLSHIKKLVSTVETMINGLTSD